MKLNCWEFKKCGREPGGEKAAEKGICPAALQNHLPGIHQGKNGGRCCWVIAGTLCQGKVQGTFAFKLRDCLQCDFYRQVLREEGKRFLSAREILHQLKSDPPLP